MSQVQQSSTQYKIDINSTFTEIAQNSFFYIDKSLDALKLLQLNSQHVMILRPPKFGKSIIMDMVEDYFLQRTNSFQKLNCKILLCGLKFSPESAATVIRFKLKTKGMTRENYTEMILNEIKKQYEVNRIAVDYNEFSAPSDALENLIAETTHYGEKKIVVLVDDIESILLSVKYNSPIFQSILATIQSIFEVLKRWKDSIHYLLLLGTANFCQVSDFVRDFTFRHETAGIFGFTMMDMINSNIFYNQIGEHPKLPETRVQVFGNFQKSLQSIYTSSLADFAQVTSTSLRGKISIEFLFYLIIHSGNYRFSQLSNASVINPIDFLCSMSESKIGTYWMNYVRSQYHRNDYFSAFPNGEDVLEKCLLDFLIRGNSLYADDCSNYKYLIPLGFLAFKKEFLCIPNITIYEFVTNAYINLIFRRCPRNYTGLRSSPFNVILEKMPIFSEYEKLPTIVFKNNCWDFALLIYLYHIFPDLSVQIANDGTFLIITKNFILSLFFTGDLEKRLTALEKETVMKIIVVKISVTKCICIETCFRSNEQIQRYKLDFYSPNYYYLTSLFPYLYTQDELDKNSQEKKDSNETEKENDNVNNDNEHVKPDKLLSFTDLVKQTLQGLTSSKNNFFALNVILNDIIKKMPHLASDPALDKSILLSLYYLSNTGYVKYRTNSKGIVEYSVLQCQCLK